MAVAGVEPVGYAGILGRYHEPLRVDFPALIEAARRVERVHGKKPSCPTGLAQLLQQLAVELEHHMMKEEQILFPYISSLAARARGESDTPSAPFGTVRNPIRMMEMEHEAVGDSMARIRLLTGGYRAPDDGCAAQVQVVELQQDVVAAVKDAVVDREARKGKGPSDHAPIVVDIDWAERDG